MFLCTKPSVRNGRCGNIYVLGLLEHGKVVVVFVGIYSSWIVLYETHLIWQNEINRTHTSALMYTHKIVRIEGNMNAMWHPNDVILPVLLPHIRLNRDMMLAKDNHACMFIVDQSKRQIQWNMYLVFMYFVIPEIRKKNETRICRSPSKHRT